MKAGIVLLVEANPITRKMLRVTLEIEGYEVVEAADGEAALQGASARRPDLVILDLVLPDADGFELLDELRRTVGAPDVPGIVITGMVSRLDELRMRAGGATQVLAKPIELAQLLELVRAQLTPAMESADGPRILVVDDEPLNLKLAAFRLERAGYQVEVASTGKEALAIGRRWLPDAILADVMMPAMDGFTFCREARECPTLAGIPIVLVSAAYVDTADRELARLMGANELVVRTPDLGDALAAIAASLRGGRRAQPGTGSAEVAALHRERLQVQLERQTSRNQTLLRQAAIHATALSVLRGLSDVLAKPRDAPQILGDVLVHCLDAAGLSTGLLYLAEPSGEHRLQAQFGIPADRIAEAEAVFGHPELMRRIVNAGEPLALSSGTAGADAETSDFLARLGHSSALILPFVVLGETVGELVLASDGRDLADGSWLLFARSLALQFGQTVALGQLLKRLAASDSRYRALMENANDAILLMDPREEILEVNREAERLLGRRREKIVGRRYQDLVVPEERAESARLQAQLLVERSLRVESRQMVRADGSRVAVEVSASFVDVGDESVVLTILRDITDRKRVEQAEKARREAQDRLEQILSSSPAVLYTLRLDGALVTPTWTSSNLERLTGYSQGEVGHHWWVERLHPDDRERVIAGFAAMLSAGSSVREYRFRHKDGIFRWIRDEQILLPGVGGVAEVVGSWFDVTARKEAELKLGQSEEQYRLLFDHNPFPVAVVDQETLAFLAVNDAAVRGYGYSREELAAMTLTDIRVPGEFNVLPTASDHRGGDSGQLGYDLLPSRKHHKKDGTVFDVEGASSPIDFRGRPAWLTMVTDVTEKKSLEAQLVRAQKMEAVGQLAGGVAHDFNNLLGVITGYSELLIQAAAVGSRERKRAEEIKAAADRAATLTRQLLAFSRRQILQPTVLDLGSVVVGVERMLRRVISADIQIGTESDADLGRVRADAGQVEQVIMNLALNARDAMAAGGRLTIETRNVELDAIYLRSNPEARPGAYVMLSVSDTGHGMDAQTAARVFEPFFTTKEEGKGTGLGLATVYGIVRQSGGLASVYSEPGLGATFRVYLPRVEATAPAVRSGPDAARSPGGSETILVVEDAEALRLLVRELLEGAGYRVLDADAPDTAMTLARSTPGPIHLVLTDLVMPRMGGQELAGMLKDLRPEAQFVFMSGYSELAIGNQGTLEPGSHFLQKPFTMDSLLQTVRRALDAKRADQVHELAAVA